jgi:hypothetical protein
MGLIQHEQIGRFADGTEHGMRAGPERNPSQHTLAGTHIYLVSSETESDSEFLDCAEKNWQRSSVS